MKRYIVNTMIFAAFLLIGVLICSFEAIDIEWKLIIMFILGECAAYSVVTLRVNEIVKRIDNIDKDD